MDSVVAIPTINNLNYLKKAVKSVRCSFPYELLVLVNGSTDGTVEWLDEQKIPYIYHEKNLGCAYVNNEAMDYAFNQDKLLFIIHNDLILHKDCLDYMYKAMVENQEYDMVYAMETVSAQANPEVMKEFYWKFTYDGDNKGLDTENDVEYTGVFPERGVNFTARAIKKTIVDKVGYFDVSYFPTYFDDNDYGLRCVLGDVKFGIVPSACFYHFWSRSIHEGGLGEINSRRFEINRRFYINKWGGTIGNETILEPNIKLMRTREEDYNIVKQWVI